jgi:murein DD-endopeptidase MepM/ murein hydrolase activator NlpD
VAVSATVALRPRRMSRLALGAAVLPLAVVLLPVIVLGDTAVTVAAPAPARPVAGIALSYLHWYVVGGRVCPQIPWNVLAGVGEVESGHGANIGPPSAGAIGPMQFLPSTWRSWGRDGNGDETADPYSPADAVVSAAHYLCFYARRFGSVGLAVAAYNAGPQAVAGAGGNVPPAAAAYVDRVLSWSTRYARQGGSARPGTTGRGGPGNPLQVCPVRGAVHFGDDFGAPRYFGGFHLHAGIDMLAPRGTPIVAPFPGRAVLASNGLGGLAAVVYGTDGYVYNAHLSWLGQLGQVRTGAVIGYVGNSGDAAGGPTHDHFEWHPEVIPAHPHVSPYGQSVVDGAIDSYPYLREVC